MTFAEKQALLQSMLQAAGVRFFNADEFMQARRGNPDPELLWHIIPTALVLDDARQELGRLLITNAYRDPSYNARIGGVSDSIHLLMNAADVVTVDSTPRKLWTFMEAHPLAYLMGIGRYASFVHVDTRGIVGRKAPARWDNTGS